MNVVVSALSQERDGFGVFLAFDVEGCVVGEVVVEIVAVIVFDEIRIRDEADADLDLPVVGEEVLVFPEESCRGVRWGI